MTELSRWPWGDTPEPYAYSERQREGPLTLHIIRGEEYSTASVTGERTYPAPPEASFESITVQVGGPYAVFVPGISEDEIQRIGQKLLTP